MRHSLDLIGRRLAARSAVDLASSIVNGCQCRVWAGALRGGYGRMWDGERVVDTHRLAKEVEKGRLTPGLDVLHRCDRNACIEPEHLWEGTPAENTADMISKGRHLAGRLVAAEKMRGQLGVRGTDHPKAKLTAIEVRMIRRRLRRKIYRRNTPAALAREFGVSDSLIRGIETGRNWAWL